jgi:3-hydroxyisobutyrate dehydrogenase-like beta-hydroxyacid dehydrogenase
MTGDESKPTIAVISVGQMGLGIAELLMQHSFLVVTSLEGRSELTRERAELAGIRVLSLFNLVHQSDIILSIVPPKDAIAMAHLVGAVATQSKDVDSYRRIASLDLNAISPRLACNMSRVINSANMIFVDGGILGFPPCLLEDGTWFRPAVITVSYWVS